MAEGRERQRRVDNGFIFGYVMLIAVKDVVDVDVVQREPTEQASRLPDLATYVSSVGACSRKNPGRGLDLESFAASGFRGRSALACE